MTKNAYFQLEEKENKVYLRIFPEQGEGKKAETEDIVRYFEAISWEEYDLVLLDAYVKKGEYETPLYIKEGEMIPERERVLVDIAEDAMVARARFYPPSTGGSSMTEDEIISYLQLAGICHGIRRKAIRHFLENHEYCRDYIIAEATKPIQGSDAQIEYFFDVNATAKPKLNEDGSVDFHHLGNIKLVEKGDKLAALKPAVKGVPGINVLGKPIPANKVKIKHLRFGRNIVISENHCNLYSKVPGHVTLVDDVVMVSDIYRVPANVDPSTGDIEYNGTVEVAGNVATGFKVKAEGDIIVNGVVEGGTLVSGGNIVLKRGMQGMDKGCLEAKGNITAKFLENCQVECQGGLKADAVLHSKITCNENVEVLGRKGLINGGSITTYGTVHATTLGSTMGSKTEITILSDKDLIIRSNEMREEMDALSATVDKIDEVADRMREAVAAGQKLEKEQIAYLKRAAGEKPGLIRKIKKIKLERESINERIQRHKNACIKAENTVFPGVDVSVKEASRKIHENLSHCRLVRDGADVKLDSL